jgi:hypothetical protein
MGHSTVGSRKAQANFVNKNEFGGGRGREHYPPHRMAVAVTRAAPKAMALNDCEEA